MTPFPSKVRFEELGLRTSTYKFGGEGQNSTHNRREMEIQVHLMPKATFYLNMLVLLKFCHGVSLTTEENEMQYLTWHLLEEMGRGI